MIAGRVGRRGQITLPRSIRQSLDLKEGDRVLFARRGDEVILQTVPYTLADLRGSVPVVGKQDFAAIRKQVIEAQSLIPDT